MDSLDDAYDLVYFASAFHWGPEDVAYTKAFSITCVPQLDTMHPNMGSGANLTIKIFKRP